MSMQILLDEKQRRFYTEALANFEAERAVHLAEVERLNGILEGIRRTLGASPSAMPAGFSPATGSLVGHGMETTNPIVSPTAKATGPYSNMNMREAILMLLKTQGPETALRMREIADILVEGGIQSGAKDVKASIAAALSILRKHGKLDFRDGRYFLPLADVSTSSEP